MTEGTPTTEPSLVTLEDAVDAVDMLEHHNLDGSHNLVVVNQFLGRLKMLAEPTLIESDQDGYIIEGALQNGFMVIDNDADMLAVSGKNLIKFVKARQVGRETLDSMETLKTLETLGPIEGAGLKKVRVDMRVWTTIGYTSSTDFRSDNCQAALDAIKELTRILALSGEAAAAVEAVNGSLKRVADWRLGQEAQRAGQAK